MTFSAAAIANGGISRFEEFTRPNNTTPYVVGGAVSDSLSAPRLLTLRNAGRFPGSGGVILAAKHTKSGTNITAASFRLHIFRDPITPLNDNTVLPLLYARRDNRIGAIDFTHVTGGAGSDCTEGFTNERTIPYASNDGNLYLQLVANGAYTPAALETHFIELFLLPF
jgi:hypothetical protein